MKLRDEELNEIKGGAIKFGVLSVIFSAVILVVGIVDGYLRPKKCN